MKNLSLFVLFALIMVGNAIQVKKFSDKTMVDTTSTTKWDECDKDFIMSEKLKKEGKAWKIIKTWRKITKPRKYCI